MPQPTTSQVHVNRPLTNIMIAYSQSADNFVADKVFPVIPVDKKSDIYLLYTKHDWMRDDAKQREPGAPASESGFNIDSTNTYTCKRWDIARAIPDELRANSDAPIDMDRDSAEWATQQLLIRREVAWTAINFVTSVWGTTATPSTLWDDSLSDPLSDVDTAIKTILQNTGLSANTAVVGYDVWLALKKHTLIKEVYKYTSSDSITPEMVARVLGIEKLYVCKSVYSTAHEKTTTPTYAFIQGKHMLVCYVEPNPGILKPSAGYTFAWTGFAGNNAGARIKKWRDEKRESDIIEAAFACDQKLVCADCGYFFLSAVS